MDLPNSSNSSSKNLPVVVDVAEHCAAREAAVSSLLDSLSTAKAGKRAFQRLDFQFRRRAQSHNPFRIPRRCREPVLRDFALAPPVVSRRPRRDRRGVRHVSRNFARRSLRPKWLGTHLWAVKRMEMASLYGYVLPTKPTQRSGRKIYRHASRGAVAYDRSWYSIIAIMGNEEHIVTVLELLGKPATDHSNSSPPSAFAFAARNPISRCQLGELEVLFARGADPGKHLVWIIMHPTVEAEIQQILKDNHVNFSCVEVLDGCGAESCMKKLRDRWSFDEKSLMIYLANQRVVCSFTIPSDSSLSPGQNLQKMSTVQRPIEVERVLPPETPLTAEFLRRLDSLSYALTSQNFKPTRRSKKRRPGHVILLKARAAASRNQTNSNERILIDQIATRVRHSAQVGATSQEGDNSERQACPGLMVFSCAGHLFPVLRVYLPSGELSLRLWTGLIRQHAKPVGIVNRASLFHEVGSRHFPEDFWCHLTEGWQLTNGELQRQFSSADLLGPMRLNRVPKIVEYLPGQDKELDGIVFHMLTRGAHTLDFSIVVPIRFKMSSRGTCRPGDDLYIDSRSGDAESQLVVGLNSCWRSVGFVTSCSYIFSEGRFAGFAYVNVTCLGQVLRLFGESDGSGDAVQGPSSFQCSSNIFAALSQLLAIQYAVGRRGQSLSAIIVSKELSCK